MSSRIEPTIDSLDSPREEITVEAEDNVSAFLKSLKEQAELNAKVISVLSSDDVSKEEKQKLVTELTQGVTSHISFFETQKEENIKEEATGIIEAIPESKVEDPLNKFKNMIGSFAAKFDPRIIFRDSSKPNWHEMGYQYEFDFDEPAVTERPTLKRLSSFINKTYNNASSFFKKIQDGTEKIQTRLFIMGEKKVVKKLEKNFSKLFNLLNLDPKEIVHTQNYSENISQEDLSAKIQQTLKDNFSIVKVNGTYNFDLLKGLTPELQYDMLSNVIFPKISKLISESMNLNDLINQSKTENKFMKMVFDFSQENNFNPDLVIHSLKTNPEILSGYKNIGNLLKNKDEIIENGEKFSKIITNNFTYIKELVSVMESLKSTIEVIEVEPKKKEQLIKKINNKTLLEKDAAKLTYSQLVQNISFVQNMPTEPKHQVKTN